MFRSIKHFFSSLNLKQIGLLEILFALTPMLSGYALGAIPLSALMWVIMLTVVFFKCGRLPLKNFMPLTLFVLFWGLHTAALLFINDLNINAIIVQLIYFLSIYAIYPIMDMRKFEGSINLVAIISIIGLIYQWSIIATGGSVHPLEIPGLSMSEDRLMQLSIRPSSYYMEPAAYVAYMIIPLAISFIRKNYIWSILMILSIFLTTSTTGILVSFIMLFTYLLTQKLSKGYIALMLVISGALFFTLTNADVFSAGVEKYENTDTETNIRLAQGPYIVGTMQPSEFIVGTGASSPYDYCITRGRAPMVAVYGESVYMSTFWMMLLMYGVVGLGLYLNVYWKIYNKSKVTLPLMACLIAVLFSSGYGISGTYIFSLISLLVLAENDSIIYEGIQA